MSTGAVDIENEYYKAKGAPRSVQVYRQQQKAARHALQI
jgi:hypothetical protein